MEQWGEREKKVKWDTHPHAMLMKHFTSRKIYNAKAEKSSRVRFPTFKLLTFHGPEVSNSRFCTLSLSDLDPNAAIITYSFKVAIPIRIRFLPRESAKLKAKRTEELGKHAFKVRREGREGESPYSSLFSSLTGPFPTSVPFSLFSLFPSSSFSTSRLGKERTFYTGRNP